MKTYFISGHRDITEEEFNINYKPLIDKALSEDSSFIVGDYEGVDHMTQQYLFGKTNNGILASTITGPNHILKHSDASYISSKI